MMRLAMSTVLAAALSGGLTTVGSAESYRAPQANRAGAVLPGPVTKSGWWIRVSPANQANNLSWRFGGQRNRLGTPVRWWQGESPNEFDLPAAQRGLPTLHVAAIGLPYTEPVSFCLFFQDHGAELFEFTAEKNAAVEQSMRSEACVP
jgi:hypothetical protein